MSYAGKGGKFEKMKDENISSKVILVITPRKKTKDLTGSTLWKIN